MRGLSRGRYKFLSYGGAEKKGSINESFQMTWLGRAKTGLQECVHILMNELEAEDLTSEPGLEDKGSGHPNKRFLGALSAQCPVG